MKHPQIRTQPQPPKFSSLYLISNIKFFKRNYESHSSVPLFRIAQMDLKIKIESVVLTRQGR